MIHIYEGFCPDELQPDSRDPNCPACQVEAERDALRKYLEDLTPGGSEFHNSPELCFQWVQQRLSVTGKLAAKRNQLAIDWIQDNAPDYVLQYLDQDANKAHLYIVSLEMGLDDLEKQIERLEAERDALKLAYAVAAAIMRSQPVGIAPRLVSEWRAAVKRVEAVTK